MVPVRDHGRALRLPSVGATPSRTLPWCLKPTIVQILHSWQVSEAHLSFHRLTNNACHRGLCNAGSRWRIKFRSRPYGWAFDIKEALGRMGLTRRSGDILSSPSFNLRSLGPLQDKLTGVPFRVSQLGAARLAPASLDRCSAKLHVNKPIHPRVHACRVINLVYTRA